VILQRWSTVFLLFAVPICAQHQDDEEDDYRRDAYISVQASKSGDVLLAISWNDSPTEGGADLPSTIGCRLMGKNSSEWITSGVCRKLLKPGPASPLHLSPLVDALHKRGVQSVVINLALPSDFEGVPPAGWESPLKEYNDDFQYTSRGEGDLPPDFPVAVAGPPSLAQVLVPVTVVLFVPGLLSYWIRLRALNGAAGRKVQWIVWMNWINLGSWLYWIGAVNTVDVKDLLLNVEITNGIVVLVAGVAFFAGPPLFAIATSLIGMAPLLSSSRASFLTLLKRQVMAEASIMVPLGIFISSSTKGMSAGLGVGVGMLGAYVVYRVLAWYTWVLSYGEMQAVESGDLFDRASALAAKAGTKIARLGLLRTRIPEEANAFASSGDTVTLTESLVRGLTPREVDAVIAHELGHHTAGHLRFNASGLLLLVYIFVAGPLIGFLMRRFGIQGWIASLPVMPLLFVMLQGFLSQKREFTADARAVEITGDPEGTIAALARLSQLSGIPTQSGGMMGSILSHPSMEQRVLALARRHNVPDTRALAILESPDCAYDQPVARLASAVAPAATAETSEPVFTLRTKAGAIEQLRWLHFLAPVFAAAAAGMLYLVVVRSEHYPYVSPMWSYRSASLLVFFWLFVLAPAAALAADLAAEVLWSTHFESRMRRALSARLDRAPDSVFVGLHPGSDVRYTEGFADWDFGFLTLENEWLCYRGEKTSFAIPREGVLGIREVQGRWDWLRERRVEISFAGGAFTFNTNFAGCSVRERAATIRRLLAWRSTPVVEPTPAPSPPPLLPFLPGMTVPRLAYFWNVVKTTIKTILLSTALATLAWRWPEAWMALLTLDISVPIARLLRELPGMIWPIRRPPESAARPMPPTADAPSVPAPAFIGRES
jgi:Zn-dependent protease with chaperone function